MLEYVSRSTTLVLPNRDARAQHTYMYDVVTRQQASTTPRPSSSDDDYYNLANVDTLGERRRAQLTININIYNMRDYIYHMYVGAVYTVHVEHNIFARSTAVVCALKRPV